jgi:uncharacterized protein YndB with AHSA1/START domain
VPDILHDFRIKAPPARVFAAISLPTGLDRWWTLRSAGAPRLATDYELGFGPGYDWRARVTRCVLDREFELELTEADPEWLGTKVGFQLAGADGGTQVRFHHVGWPHDSEHYRISSYCWAMYLRLLRRYLEHGETVDYGRRLEA